MQFPCLDGHGGRASGHYPAEFAPDAQVSLSEGCELAPPVGDRGPISVGHSPPELVG
jgi:hypothetical protein